MVGEDTPGKLIVSLILARAGRSLRPLNFESKFASRMQRVLQHPELRPVAFGLQTEMEFVYYVDDQPPRLWLRHSEDLARWELDLGFLQAGFVNPERLGNAPLPFNAISTSLCAYDAAVCAANTLDPLHLPPLEVCKRGHDEFVRVVDGLYERRVCFLNRPLMPYRSALLVAAHATLCGLDGVAEYQRFAAAGGQCHLQYRGLAG